MTPPATRQAAPTTAPPTALATALPAETASVPAEAPLLEGPALVDLLKRGGHVIFFRHAATDSSQTDTDTQNLANCQAQRNLTEQGRSDARAIGQAVQALGIPVGPVLASPYCRTLETARLAFAPVEPSRDLLPTIASADAADREALVTGLRRLLGTPSTPGVNTILVSHASSLQDATGIAIAEGEAAVFAPGGANEFRLVARVLPTTWPTLVQTSAAGTTPAPAETPTTSPSGVTPPPASGPVPIVTGPIPGAPPGTGAGRDYPQFAAEPFFDLAGRGYVEQEFFVQGEATRYELPALADAVVRSTGHPYKTRLLVRRPLDPTRFNGVVVVEWVNVTGGDNVDAHWVISREYLTREGYAWVGVSAQRVGVHGEPSGLIAWSPARYGTLDVTAGGTVTDDSLAYDIFSQAGRAVRGRPELLGGLRPEVLLGVGLSQSASRLVPYYNAIQPLHGVYDGFMPSVGDRGPFRTDVPAKVLRLDTETEVVLNWVRRQPDSDTYRGWEIAGGSHIDYWFATFRQPYLAREGMPSSALECARTPFSRVDSKVVYNAGYQHLVEWVRGGAPPPVAPPIQTTPRDANGLARGGIRLAAVDAPTATNTGENAGAGVCYMLGSHEPFSAAQFAALYPTHDAYVQAVREVTARNVRDGFVLPADADEIVRAAVESRVGAPNP